MLIKYYSSNMRRAVGRLAAFDAIINNWDRWPLPTLWQKSREYLHMSDDELTTVCAPLRGMWVVAAGQPQQCRADSLSSLRTAASLARQQVFVKIYSERRWWRGGEETWSGLGSTMASAKGAKALLESALKSLVASGSSEAAAGMDAAAVGTMPVAVLDLGCGEMNWQRERFTGDWLFVGFFLCDMAVISPLTG